MIICACPTVPFLSIGTKQKPPPSSLKKGRRGSEQVGRTHLLHVDALLEGWVEGLAVAGTLPGVELGGLGVRQTVHEASAVVRVAEPSFRLTVHPRTQRETDRSPGQPWTKPVKHSTPQKIPIVLQVSILDSHGRCYYQYKYDIKMALRCDRQLEEKLTPRSPERHWTPDSCSVFSPDEHGTREG